MPKRLKWPQISDPLCLTLFSGIVVTAVKNLVLSCRVHVGLFCAREVSSLQATSPPQQTACWAQTSLRGTNTTLMVESQRIYILTIYRCSSLQGFFGCMSGLQECPCNTIWNCCHRHCPIAPKTCSNLQYKERLWVGLQPFKLQARELVRLASSPTSPEESCWALVICSVTDCPYCPSRNCSAASF
jgi:hypothetical protein